MVVQEQKPTFVGLGAFVGLIALLAMPVLLLAWWRVLPGLWFGPFVTLALVGGVLLFIPRLRGTGVGLILAATVWCGLVLWFLNHLAAHGGD